MNQQYIDNNDLTIVIDENGNRTIREHKENIEELLIQENLIEALESKKDKIKNELNKMKVKEHYLPITPFLAETISIFLLYLAFLIISDNANIIETIITGFNQNNIIANITLITVIPITLGIYIDSDYRRYKDKKNHKKGLEKKLEKLEEKIKEEREYLNSLNNEKEKEYLNSLNNKNNSNKATITRVNDTNQIMLNLDELLDLYYQIGMNEEEYLKYYQTQTLPNKLKGSYTPEEIKEINNYFEAQKKLYVKKR